MKIISQILLSFAFVAALFAAPAGATSADTQTAAHKADRATAYYHYTLAHMYEEQIATYGRMELVSKAIEEYRLAIDADPSSEFLTSSLAELYAKTGRIADAVTEAKDIIKRDPNNLEAHKLLGRIYLRSLGDMPGGSGSENMLKLAIEQYQQIVKIEPNSVDDHLLLGRLYRLNNDLQKSEAELKTAIKLDPSSEEAITSLSILYTEEGDTTRALQVLSSVPDAARSAKLYAALGSTYEQRKDYKGAIDAFKRAVQLDRDNLDAIRGLAENLLNDGQTDAALDQFKVIADANPEDARAFLRMAEIYRRQGKFDLALDALKKAEGLVPDSMEVAYNQAAVYQTMGRFDDATKLLQELLKKTEKPQASYSSSDRENRAIFYQRLGTVYRDQGNYPAAVEAFRGMLTLGDENARTGYQEAIDTYREGREWSKATATAKEAVQKLPNDRDMRIVYASQLADSGQPDEALAQVRAELKGAPEDRMIYIALAQMSTRLKRWPDAEDALNKAEGMSTKPEEKQYIDFLRGSTFEREKKYDEAEAEFRKVLMVDPNNATTLNYLGYMNADRGVRLEESLGYIKLAVQLEPANSAFLDSLGWAYFKLGKYDLAESNLLKASQHMGADPTVQAHMGDLYQKTGRLKLAVTHWERALDGWNKTVAAEVDADEVARTQKNLDAAKVKLAKDQGAKE